MSSTIEKRVQIDEERAGRLEWLAISQGTTPEALIAKALDLLFLVEPASPDIPVELRADWELLQKLEAESSTPSGDAAAVPSVVGTPSHFDLTQGKVTHVVPVPAGRLRRFGEDH